MTDSGTPLRVLSYNVRSMRDDVQALASVIRACRPDVLCVQEAPRFLRWRTQLARLARESGLVYACGGRTTHGPALLVALGVDVLGVSEFRFRKAPGLHARGLAVADCRKAGSRFRVASMHLGLREEERERNVTDALAALGDARPLVLAGDVNEPPGGPAWRLLHDAGLRDAYAAARWGEELTFSSASPRRRIDAVFASAGVTVERCGVPTVLEGVDPGRLVAATDHRPLLAELQLP
ncbi:endonuclease/exonuclease/phosphatase family protein [Motilibacter aurantiacus]|uniref:endonuclease/exonuclease/phosphatase family protein n=1 Tax=Motilibacter aurantiacus TaxID=2714955 RepID=UPI00140AB333|nr:endonuclease/exonuclease/phosphatase family protein [Motilibacter aurantiacus]NHC45627.1 endonuclease [Motilibacter aurantiacus]